MKIKHLSGWLAGWVVALGLTVALCGRAYAFGGLWSSQAEPVRQAAERIIFVDNADSTVTAIVQLKYAGPPQQFAWLIPVAGTPTVAVSSNVVFERLDAATAPEYWVEEAIEGMCMQPAEGAVAPGDAAAGGAPNGPIPMGTPVAMLDQGSVGPYDYVTLTVDETAAEPARVAADWLTANGYDLTRFDSEVLRPYLEAGLNLLAFKLTNGKDAGAIRPVALTYESERPIIPIRPTAGASQPDLGIQLWVLGPSQAVPDNYASLVLNDARIDWLSSQTFVQGTLPAGGVGPFGPRIRRPSNYDALVTAAANEAGGQGFVTELGGSASQFREKVWSLLDDQTFTRISTGKYADGIAAIVAAGAQYGSWDGWLEAIEGATTLPSGVSLDEFAREPERHRDGAQVDLAKFLELLGAKVVQPAAASAALLANAPYLTRLFTTLSADEMTLDPSFDYNVDLAQVGNVHIAEQYIECTSPTLSRSDAPWRVELPQGGVVVSDAGGNAWPVAAGSLPANLKVVRLSSEGSGDVVEDNSGEIGSTLLARAGRTSSSVAMPRPQNGALIGGTQTVKTFEPSSPPTPNHGAKPGGDGGCSALSATGTGSGTGPSALALAVPLLGLALQRRRRRRRCCGIRTPGKRRSMKLRAAWVWACLLLAGCSSDDEAALPVDAGVAFPPGSLTREQLRDPETCKGCHPTHYREWQSSMHAYSAKDPVFLAMNKRGQRETNGELGDFCVKCHAPMAAVDGLTKNGLDIEQLPDKERGVSCYFCHNVVGVEGEHNALMHLGNDNLMRGPIADPFKHFAHEAEYSEFFEDTMPQSSSLCGGCHDIKTPNGVHLERTFLEYRSGIFSKSATGEPPSFDSCVGCHMPGRQGFAAVAPEGVRGDRQVHEHLWPGIDVPLIDFPNRAAMRSAVEDCQLGAASISFFKLEVTPPNLFTFQVETNAGHNQPSGSAQDRRLWLEFMAYDERGELIAEASSGNIADDEVEERPKDDPKHDPHLLMFRDRIFDAQGKPVHMFWEAAKSQAYPDGFESNLLPVATTTYIEGKRAVVKQYRASGPDGELPARVTARLRMRPIGLDVLQDLVDSGDLDPAVMAEMPTMSFGAQIEWTKEDGLMKTVSADVRTDCTTYRCLLDPSSPKCK